MLNGKKSVLYGNASSVVDRKMKVFWETVYGDNEAIENRASRELRLISGYPFDI